MPGEQIGVTAPAHAGNLAQAAVPTTGQSSLHSPAPAGTGSGPNAPEPPQVFPADGVSPLLLWPAQADSLCFSAQQVDQRFGIRQPMRVMIAALFGEHLEASL